MAQSQYEMIPNPGDDSRTLDDMYVDDHNGRRGGSGAVVYRSQGVQGWVGGVIVGFLLSLMAFLVFQHRQPVMEQTVVDRSWATSWTKSRDYCILMSDTRRFHRPSPPTRFDDPLGEAFTYREAAAYYNMRYAMRHGYHFELIHSADFDDRFGTWPKVKAIYDMVANTDCEITLFLDTDAFFTDPYLRLEDIIQRWGFDNTSYSMAVPLEPGGYSINTGVWLMRQGEVTKRTLMEIMEYPDRTGVDDCPGYEDGCAHWKQGQQYEQSVLDLYFKERMLRDGTLLELPCNDAWGFPGDHEHNCRGEIITHFMVHKDVATEEIKRALLRLYVDELNEYLDDEHFKSCDAPRLGLESCSH